MDGAVKVTVTVGVEVGAGGSGLVGEPIFLLHPAIKTEGANARNNITPISFFNFVTPN
jgi:hypothetical protein